MRSRKWRVQGLPLLLLIVIIMSAAFFIRDESSIPNSQGKLLNVRVLNHELRFRQLFPQIRSRGRMLLGGECVGWRRRVSVETTTKVSVALWCHAATWSTSRAGCPTATCPRWPARSGWRRWPGSSIQTCQRRNWKPSWNPKVD